MPKQYFVTGIDTDAGKTLAAAILTEALNADYWKPVQTGTNLGTDTDAVRNLISPLTSRIFHPETYRFVPPVSPHWAAEQANATIELNKFKLPKTENNLIVEGAGGLHVPLNEEALLIDLIQQLNIPVVLVSKVYLGSINHTLLSIEALQRRNIPIAGIIFNGEHTPSTEDYIIKYTGVKLLGRIEQEATINHEVIQKYAEGFQRLL